jgi:pimeloyl-ACP methyl ester carboxylesterase
MPTSPHLPPPVRTAVATTDGLTLASWSTTASGPPIVLVHGYPDTHHVWDAVVGRLSPGYRCITYDVRGAGESDAPPERSGYRLSHLVSDLVAVIDAHSPDEPVHLVGHDWGSIQSWDAVVRESSDTRLRGRIASYTSISGPSLHHADAYVAAARRGDWQRRREALGQLAHSWYVYAFHVPVLPEQVFRGYAWWSRRRASSPRRVPDTLERDARNGLELYRANIFHREPVPGGPRTSVPVQLIVPLRDPFVTPSFVGGVGRFARDLTRSEVDAGHWVVRTHPDQVARLVGEFVEAHDASRSPGDRP